MKRPAGLPRIAPLLFLLAIACGGELLRIDVRQQAETTVEQGTPLEQLIGDIGFGDFLNMDITASQELQNQGVSPGDITEVWLTQFVIEVEAPDGADLAFLESVELYIEAPDLPRVLVASATEFDGQTRVEFELEDVDISDYVISQSMTLDTEVSGRRPDQDTDLVADFTLNIGVTQQGACAAIEAA